MTALLALAEFIVMNNQPTVSPWRTDQALFCSIAIAAMLFPKLWLTQSPEQIHPMVDLEAQTKNLHIVNSQ